MGYYARHIDFYTSLFKEKGFKIIFGHTVPLTTGFAVGDSATKSLFEINFVTWALRRK